MRTANTTFAAGFQQTIISNPLQHEVRLFIPGQSCLPPRRRKTLHDCLKQLQTGICQPGDRRADDQKGEHQAPVVWMQNAQTLFQGIG